MERIPSEDLAQRVARIESSIRRDRTIALAVVALAVITAQTPHTSSSARAANAPITVKSASGSATLTATGLTVRDAKGHERAFVGIDDSGYPSMDLADSSGELRQSIYLLKDTPMVRQFDSSGNRRLQMSLDSSSNGELLLNDQNEKLRLALYRASNGDPQLDLYGSDEKVRAYLATDDDSPYLVMKDNAGNIRLVVGGYTSGKIGMDIRDASNNSLWQAP